MTVHEMWTDHYWVILDKKTSSNKTGQAKRAGDPHGKGKEVWENEGKNMGKAPKTRNTCITLSGYLEKYRKLLDCRNLPTKESHGTQWKVTKPLPHGLVEVVQILDPVQAKKNTLPF